MQCLSIPSLLHKDSRPEKRLTNLLFEGFPVQILVLLVIRKTFFVISKVSILTCGGGFEVEGRRRLNVNEEKNGE